MASHLTQQGFGPLRDHAKAMFAWWTDELTSMAPDRLRSRHRRTDNRFMLLLDEGGISLLEAEKGRATERGRADVDDQEAVSALLSRCRSTGRSPGRLTLRLDRRLGLQHALDLPLAARHDVDQAILFELDRLTPFEPDDVWFAAKVDAVDRKAGRMTVALDVAPKDTVEQALALIERNGLLVQRVEIEGDTDSEPLDLLAPVRSRAGQPRRRRLLLPAIACALGLIALLSPLLRQEMAIAALQSESEILRPAAEANAELRERLDRLATERGFLINAKNGQPTMTEILAELTRLIPDQAYILQLEIEDGGLDLFGLADNATALIGILDGSPLFEAPTFRAPITKDASTGQDRFQIGLSMPGRDV